MTTHAKIIASAVICLMLAVVTIVMAQQFRSSYYVVSVLLMLYTFIPFMVSFEGRKPKARELMIIAVMAAISVASRAAFFWAPNFKPMAAIVMLSGIALGPQSGLLVGAVSIFVSNFLFGQGPWTPWQMLAFGLAGFVFGALAKVGVFKSSNLSTAARVALGLSGGVFVLVVLGPILDTSSLFTMVSTIKPSTIVAVYTAGVPMNAIHALSTLITLFVAANPILDKLDHVVTKYGILRA